MTEFRLREPLVGDDHQQRVNDGIVEDLNTLGQFVSWGTGVPAFTPAGRAAFFRTDGGAGSTFYIYNGTSWTAVA